MRAIFGGVLAVALGSCAPAVHELSLSDLDLADSSTLTSLQDALPPDDRAALGTYALLHWPKSKFYCGKPIRGREAEVSTVGEAIALTRAYEAELELAQRAEEQTPAVVRQTHERALITQMDHLLLERDMLFTRGGPAATETPRAAEIAQQLAGVRAQLSDLRSGPVG